MDSIQGGTQAATAIVNDRFQTVFTAQTLLLQLAQEGQPAFGIFSVGQVPGQNFLAAALRPDAQGDACAGTQVQVSAGSACAGS